MPKAIIDTTTRVIKRLTTDDVPSMDLTESFVDLGDIQIDLTSFKKLDVDNKTFLIPTQKEIDDSKIDPVRVDFFLKQKQELVKTALDSLIADATVPQTVRDYFQAIINLRK